MVEVILGNLLKGQLMCICVLQFVEGHQILKKKKIGWKIFKQLLSIYLERNKGLLSFSRTQNLALQQNECTIQVMHQPISRVLSRG